MTRLLLLASSVSALLAIVACAPAPTAGPDKSSSRTTGDKNDPNEEGDDDDSPAAGKSCLAKAKLEVKNEECSSCISEADGCCEATIACFQDDDDCAALHHCMLECGGAAGTPSTPTDPTMPVNPSAQGRQIFVSDVYPALIVGGSKACSSCHIEGPGTPFLANTADASYAEAKAFGPNKLLTRGEHAGPALNPTQRSAINSWIAAEMNDAMNAGNGTPEPGMTSGTGGAACRDKCQAQHPDALPKWRKYNTCAWSTCKDACR